MPESRHCLRLPCAAATAGLLAVALCRPPTPAAAQPVRLVNPNLGIAHIDPTHLVQEFPSSGPKKTAWSVHWGYATAKGLFIKNAYFRRGPGQPWVKILHDARLSDIHVPYEAGSPRFLDLIGFKFDMLELTAADAGANGILLGLPGDSPRVVREVRDRGLLWKHHDRAYRGEELVLWGAMRAAYYNYIMQYGFRDDGTVTFRLGATATNRPNTPGWVHMHSGLWRIDIDLAGFAHDSAQLVRHVEPASSQPQDQAKARDRVEPFGGGREAGVVWSDTEFTYVRVIDEQAPEVCGKKIAYDLLPMRAGTARHFASAHGYDETFTQKDLWVTRYRMDERLYMELPAPNGYVGNRESTQDTDLVLWYISSAHHEPRHEDGRMFREADGRTTWTGAAVLMWSGFDLRPRNFYSGTPFFPFPSLPEVDCKTTLKKYYQ